MTSDCLLLAANESAVMVDFINLNRGQVPGQTILAMALIIYLIGLFALSLFASRRIENEEDFLVAGRRLGFFLCWGSLIATWFGAASMTGSSSAAREEGMRGTILDPWACSLTLVIAGVFYAPKLWRMKLLTAGDFFRRVYGPRAEMACCAVQIPTFFGWMAGEFMALAAVQRAYFQIDEHWGILIGFGITLTFTMVGGMWSVTLIDTLQILIAFIGVCIMTIASFAAFGVAPTEDAIMATTWQNFSAGLMRFFREIPSDDLSLLPPADVNLAIILAYTGTWATGLLGNLPGQDLQQRIFSAKDARTARAACIWSGILYLLFALLPVLVGLMSRLELPLSETVVEVKVLMYMAGKNMNVYLAVIFVISFVSVVISTACSAVLAPATILGHNFLGRWKALQKSPLRVERISVLVVALGGLGLAYSGESLLGLLDLSLSIALAALFVPLTMGLYGKPRGELSAILATVLGLTFYTARNLPEKFFLPLPSSLERYGSVQTHFDRIKRTLSPDERTSNQVIRAKLDEAKSMARSDMQSELQKYTNASIANELVDAKFDSGFDWLSYIELRFASNRIGELPHRVLIAILTIPADLYGLAASCLGYLMGQSILKRHGVRWKPGALDPPLLT